ncbi:MAG: Na+:solute symporter [Acidobacteria bacterium]|nr:Na+:solute symporter [Acidobacteriota bacterium]
MHLHRIDWIIIYAYLAFTIVIGIIFSKRGTKNIDEYFVAGRNLPWWLAGITMAASAFAIDTPLGITGMVAANGIPGVWYAWSFVLGGAGAMGAFIFASLLRRSEVITFAELIELRYDGNGAAFLRGFKSIYFGIFANAITLGWIIKAVMIISKDVIGFNPNTTLLVILGFTLFYTTLSGMWGIVATDFIQFFIGLIGVVTLSIFAWKYIGGLDNITAGFTKLYGAAEAKQRLSFFPSVHSDFFITFIVFITMKWWSNPPAAIHQRIVASKNEKHASFSTLLFSVTAFAINYWPMIVIAVVAILVFPNVGQPEQAYGLLMAKLLPTGLLGLMLASMMAAFMSTVDTHINFGAAFIVNDLYKRFIKKDGTAKHYVHISQISTVFMLLFAVFIAYNLDSVSQAWYYLATLTAGYGFLIVARWFWWRINAWSEISALIASGVASSIFSPKISDIIASSIFGGKFVFLNKYAEYIGNMKYGYRFICIVAICSVVWILVTIFTKPSGEKRLVEFCTKVKPYPLGWKPIYTKYPDIQWNPFLVRNLLQWIFGVIAIFCTCFGIGSLIFKDTATGLLLLLASIAIFTLIYMTWRGETKVREQMKSIKF